MESNVSKTKRTVKDSDSHSPPLKRKRSDLASAPIENVTKQKMEGVASSVVFTSHVATVYRIGDFVNERYRIVHALGTGYYAEVYLVSDNLKKGKEYALKVEKVSKWSSSVFRTENLIYNQIQGGIGIPKVSFFGADKKTNSSILVIEKLGPSLFEMLEKCGKFTCMTTAMLAEQMIERVEYIHGRNIMHRDIKPHNFLLGLGQEGETTKVYLIDYGIAKHLDDKSKPMKPRRPYGNVTGTARYASVHSHSGCELSRRDDLESLAYVLVYFMNGTLPWLTETAATTRDLNTKIGQIKMSTSPEVLCEGLPKEFESCVTYCRQLTSEEVPDYAFLLSLFRKLIADCKKNGSAADYDWNLCKDFPSLEQQTH